MDTLALIKKAQRLFGDDNQIFIHESDFVDWINDAQLQIVRETKCLIEEVVTTAAAFPWTMPADFLKMGRILYNNVALTSSSVDDLDAKQFDLTEQAAPQFYYVVKSTISLFPDPRSTDTTPVVIQYLKIPAAVVSTTDPLTIPSAYHEDVVQFCVARANYRNENYRGYELSMDEFNSRIGTRIDETDQVEGSYPIIRDDPYSWL